MRLRWFVVFLFVGLCSASDKDKKVLFAADGSVEKRSRPVIAYSAEYEMLYWGSATRLFWSSIASQEDAFYHKFQQSVACLATSSQGSFVACGNTFNYIREEPLHEVDTLFSLECPVAALAVSPKRSLCAISMDRSYSLLDYLEPKLRAPFYEHDSRQATYSLCYYDDNALYCSSGLSVIRYDDRDKKAAFAVKGAHLDPISQLCKGPEYQLVSASLGGSVRIWDVRKTNERLRRFVTEPLQPITALVYAAGMLVVGNDVGKIYAWSLTKDGNHSWQEYDEQSVVALAATKNGFASVGSKLPFVVVRTIAK